MPQKTGMIIIERKLLHEKKSRDLRRHATKIKNYEKKKKELILLKNE